jgi:hypothetical protein
MHYTTIEPKKVKRFEHTTMHYTTIDPEKVRISEVKRNFFYYMASPMQPP